MPSTSKKQANFMRAVAHSPKFAEKVGVPVSVGKKFVKEDKETDMKRYMKGGKMPSAPSLPSQASSKASEALERFAGKRSGMLAGGKVPAAPKLPDSASSKASEAISARFAGARGMMGGGSTKTPNPRKGGDLYNLGTNQNPKGMKKGGKTKMQEGGMVPLMATSSPIALTGGRPRPASPLATARSLPSKLNQGMAMRNIPTLPAQASQRARDIMDARLAARNPITTPGGPDELTPESPPAMPQIEVMPEAMPAVMPRVPLKRPVGMYGGGMTKSSGKSRMDGCATKGKTRGRMV